MSKFDLKDGFYHLGIHHDWVDYFGIIIPGSSPSRPRYGRYRALSFGGKSSPALFQGAHMEIRRLLMANGFITGAYLIYVDDSLLGSDTEAEAQTNFNSYLLRMRELGVIVNEGKTIPPCQELPFTGVTINTRQGFIALTADRQRKLAARIRTFLADVDRNGCVKLGDVDQLTGKLMNAAFVFNRGRSALDPLYETKHNTLRALHYAVGNQYPPKSTAVRFTDAARSGLEWWLERLQGQSIIKRPLFVFSDLSMDIWDADSVPLPLTLPDAPKKLLKLISDASSTGYAYREEWSGFQLSPPIGCQQIDRIPHAAAGVWKPQESVNTSNWRELRTIVLAVSDALSRARKERCTPRFILCTSDNDVSVSIINKLKTGSPALRVLVDDLRKMLDPSNIQLAARHIKGSDNVVTDEDSRLAEKEYSSRPISSSLLKSCERILSIRFQSVGDALPPPKSKLRSVKNADLNDEGASLGPTLFVPPPATRMESLKSLRELTKATQPVVVLVPTLGPAANPEFSTVLEGSFTRVHSWADSFLLHVYDSPITVTSSHGAGDVILPSRMAGWSLWSLNLNKGTSNARVSASEADPTPKPPESEYKRTKIAYPALANK